MASPSRVTELRRRPRRGTQVCSRWCFSARSRWPDGSDAAIPLNCCRGGVAELFVVSKFRGDLEETAGFRLILVEEGGEAEHVQGEAVRVSAGDDEAMGLIRLILLGNHLGVGDGRCLSAVAIHLLGVPIDIVADGLREGLFEGFGFDDDVLVHRNEVLALYYKLGHWISPVGCFQRPDPCQLLSAGVVIGQPAPKGLSPSSAR